MAPDLDTWAATGDLQGEPLEPAGLSGGELGPTGTEAELPVDVASVATARALAVETGMAEEATALDATMATALTFTVVTGHGSVPPRQWSQNSRG